MTSKGIFEKAELQYTYKSKVTGGIFDDDLTVARPRRESDYAFMKRLIRMRKQLGPKPGLKGVISKDAKLTFILTNGYRMEKGEWEKVLKG